MDEIVARAQFTGLSEGESLALAAELLRIPRPADAAADAQALLARAESEFERLAARAKAAFTVIPAGRAAGFHSAAPDLRAFVLYQAVSLLREAGAYLPAELRARLDGSERAAAWVAAESVRLLALLRCTDLEMDAVEGRRLRPGEFGDRLRELVRELAAI